MSERVTGADAGRVAFPPREKELRCTNCRCRNEHILAPFRPHDGFGAPFPSLQTEEEGDMATIPGAIGAAVLLGTAEIGLATPGYSHRPAFASINVCIGDESGIGPAILEEAKADVVDKFADISVTLLWTCPVPSLPSSPDAPSVTLETRLRLFVKILPAMMVGRYGSAAESMGSAPGTPEARGKVAYVFFSRIQTFAETHRVDVARLLACVMAHELGHLLLPHGAHSETGIMRGEWNPVSLRYATRGQLGFTAAQGELIRQRIGGVHQNSLTR